MRTPVNYYVAQLLGANGNNAIVLGTGNYDEDGYLRYFCKVERERKTRRTRFVHCSLFQRLETEPSTCN